MHRWRMSFVSVCVLSTALLVGCGTSALANDTSFGASGAPYPGPRPNPHVRMVSEIVEARIVGEVARVNCRFVFRNEGPRQRLRIGFPEETGGDIPERGLIRRFASSVDGRPVQVKRVVLRSDSHLGGFFVWWMKDVAFEPGQTRQVRNEYEINLSVNSVGLTWFTYFLHTGASWKGRIGDATIIVDLGTVNPRRIIGLGTKPTRDADERSAINPPGFVRQGTRLVWRFENLEPTKKHDILVAWR